MSRVRRWIRELSPTWGAIIVIGAAVTFGGATTLTVSTQLNLPRQNAARIDSVEAEQEAHDSLPQHATQARVNETLRHEIDALSDVITQSLCMSASDKDPSIPWERCIDPDRLRAFRNGN